MPSFVSAAFASGLIVVDTVSLLAVHTLGFDPDLPTASNVGWPLTLGQG
jgi:hypothetical protein